MSRVGVLLFFLVLAGLFPDRGDVSAEQGPIVIRIGHVTSPNSIFGLSLAEFERRLKAKLGNKVSFDIQDSSKLGNEGELLRKMRAGEALFAPIAIVSDVDDQFGIFDMPYLVLTRDHLKARRAKLVRDFLGPAAKAKGLRLLALWELGFRHITNSVKPIDGPKELQGLKLRVPTGRWQPVVFSTFGAQTVSLPYDKVPKALENKEVDGQENPLSIIESSKLYQVQSYLSLTGHTYQPGYFFVSDEYFTSLPKNIQMAIIATAKEMEDWTLELGTRLDASLRDELSKTMAVNEVDKLSFILASLPIYQKFSKTVPNGKALIKLMYDSSSIKAHH